MNSFSLEGAIMARAHSHLRTDIGTAMAAMHKLLERLTQSRQHELRKEFDKFEDLLFRELQVAAEKEAMTTFISTYEEVAAIVNAAKAKDRVALERNA